MITITWRFVILTTVLFDGMNSMNQIKISPLANARCLNS